MWAAKVDYSATMYAIGWDVLNVTTNQAYPDWLQAYAAGYGEGVATYESVWNNYINSYGTNASAPPLQPKVIDFLKENWQWMATQVETLNETDAIWTQVGLQMQQTRGLQDGLNAAAPIESQRFDFVRMQSMLVMGDLYDLQPALYPLEQAEWRTMKKVEYDSWFAKRTRCSALIKLALDLSDIFFGHATWSTYNTMLRTYKHYNLNYRSANSKQVSFSSYPGALSSIDDYYVTDTGLAIIETSIAILNTSMYNGTITPQSLLYWVRVMTTTRIASSGEDWVNIFAEYNSGTYNNQWMVLDMKLFTPYQSLKPGTLYIAEQMPGTVGIRDRTSTLEYGYWPSYNIPSIPELYVQAGYQEASQLTGWEMNDYQRCVRAQIFRRDQTNVFDMPAFMNIMQYNNYETDPISQGNPIYAIASRGDLLPPGLAQCFGAIDAKVSSYFMYQNGREVMAYSGPTPQQPNFDFAATNATFSCTPRNGLKNTWDYLWVHFKPVE